MRISLPAQSLFRLVSVSFLHMLLAITFTSISFAHDVSAQELLDKRVTLRLENQRLRKVLKEIETQASIHFAFRPREIPSEQKLTLIATNELLGEILERLVKPLQLRYEVVGRQIVLSPVKPSTQAEANTSRTEDGHSVLNPVDRTISGTVRDESGLLLPGVSVVIKGTTKGTTTDAEGRFQLTVPDGTVTITFSFVGYIAKEVVIGNQTDLRIILSTDTKSLNEVVVVGYGTQRKRDLTGSVLSVKDDVLNQGTATSASQLLKGKAVGVEVVQNSSEPGGGVSISIRGASSINAGTGPLYVIDGLPIDNSPAITGTGANYVGSPSPRDPLSTINPADIESIDILKDASATAIYGARGANGVILVTTKRGKEGKFSVGYDGYYGVQNVARQLPLLTPNQYMTAINELQAAGAANASERVTELQNGGTNWQSLLYRDNAPVQSHNLSFTGGSAKTNYFLSLNYLNQQGVVVSSGFTRYGARLNLTHKATDKFTLGMNLSTAYTYDDYVAEGFGFNENAGALYAGFNYDPSIAAYDATGDYTRSNFINIDSPLAIAYGKNASAHSYRTFGTVYGDYQLLPGLTARLNVGGDILNRRRDVYIDRTTQDGLAASGVATILNAQQSNYLVEGTLNYVKTVNNHRLTALAGATTQKFASVNNSVTGRGFPSDLTDVYSLGTGNPLLSNIFSVKETNKLISFIGRVNYVLKEKYLFTATMRADGSTRFGNANKFGYFPSVAAGWNLDQEPFMKSLPAFSSLKVRASWGRTGNQEIGNYNSISTFVRANNIVYNDQPFSTQQPSRLPNPDLKWETTEQADIGVDFGFFNERLSGTFDVYSKSTFDMLLQLPVPTTTGFTSKLTNIGSIRNTGIELGLNSRNLIGALKWNTTLNVATLKNRVTDLGGTPRILTGGAGFANQIALIEVGQPLNSFYGYQIAGVWQTGEDLTQTKDKVSPGDLKYVDTNGDKTVNAADRVVLGNSFPKVSYSLRNSFSYHNVGLEIFFEGLQGVSMYNNNLADTYFPINFRRNRYAEPILNRWTPANPSNTYPSFVNPLNQGSRYVNSLTVEDASYLRLKVVTLSYTLPMVKGLSSAMVYVTGQNLWTLTTYQGLDPAVNPNGNATLRIDWNAYPLATSFLFGLKLGL